MILTETFPSRTRGELGQSDPQRGRTDEPPIPERPSFLSGLSLGVAWTLRGLEEGPQEIHSAETQTEDKDESERNAYEADDAQYHGRMESCEKKARGEVLAKRNAQGSMMASNSYHVKISSEVSRPGGLFRCWYNCLGNGTTLLHPAAEADSD